MILNLRWSPNNLILDMEIYHFPGVQSDFWRVILNLFLTSAATGQEASGGHTAAAATVLASAPALALSSGLGPELLLLLLQGQAAARGSMCSLLPAEAGSCKGKVIRNGEQKQKEAEAAGTRW